MRDRTISSYQREHRLAVGSKATGFATRAFRQPSIGGRSLSRWYRAVTYRLVVKKRVAAATRGGRGLAPRVRGITRTRLFPAAFDRKPRVFDCRTSKIARRNSAQTRIVSRANRELAAKRGYCRSCLQLLLQPGLASRVCSAVSFGGLFGFVLRVPNYRFHRAQPEYSQIKPIMIYPPWISKPRQTSSELDQDGSQGGSRV